MPWTSLTHIGQLNPYGVQAAVDHMPVLHGHVLVGGHGTTAQSTLAFHYTHLPSVNYKATELNASALMMHRHQRVNWLESSLHSLHAQYFRLGWHNVSRISRGSGNLQEIPHPHMTMMLARAPRVAAAQVRCGQIVMCNSVHILSCILHAFP